MKWTENKAFKRVCRVANVKKISDQTYVVERGSAGNRTLGAIDFLNKKTDYSFMILHENKFKQIKGKLV